MAHTHTPCVADEDSRDRRGGGGVIVHFLPSPPLLVARLYQLGLPSEATGSTGGQLCLSLSSGCISANYIHKHSSDCCLVTRHNGVIATVTSQLGAAISFPREST